MLENINGNKVLQNVMNSKNIIHLSHIDLDGYGSGYVVWSTFITNENSDTDRKMIQINCDYGGIIKTIEQALMDNEIEISDTSFLATDLNFNSSEIDFVKSIFGDNWFIIDHHVKSGGDLLPYIDNHILDGDRCATKLTFDTFVDLELIKQEDGLFYHLNFFSTVVNVYDLWKRESFLDFNLGTWLTHKIMTDPYFNHKLKRQHIYFIFNEFYNAGGRQSVIDLRFIQFEQVFVKKLWKKKNPDLDLNQLLLQIYPDLNLVDEEDYLDYIPINVLQSYSEYSYLKNYEIFADENIVVFSNTPSKIMNRLYDILFLDTKYKSKIMININVNKKEDIVTVGLRSKNFRAGDFAKLLPTGGGHPNAGGGSIKTTDLNEALDVIKVISSTF